MPVTDIDGRQVIEHGSFIIPNGSSEAKLGIRELFLRIRIDPARAAGETLAEATPQGPVLYIGKLTLTQVAAWTGRLDGGGHSYLVHISARAVAADDFTVHTIDYIVTV